MAGTDPDETSRDRETTVEVGLPAWLAVAKVTHRWSRTQIERRHTYVEDVVEAAGVAHEVVLGELEGNERLSDVFLSGLGRATEISDPGYQSALSKLVGAAFHDAAQIDEVAYLTAQLVRLEPVHLRVLQCFLRRRENGEPSLNRSGHLVARSSMSARSCASLLAVNVELVAAALERLLAEGFIRLDPQSAAVDQVDAQEAVQKRRMPPHRLPKYNLRAWGREALELCLGMSRGDGVVP